MEKNSVTANAEKYKQEMMKLYGKSTSKIENEKEDAEKIISAVNVLPEENKPPVAENEADREIIAEVESDDIPEDYNETEELYPEPDLSEIITDHDKISDTDENDKLGKYIDDTEYNGKGYIIVNVRTGDQADPIENAVVHISSIKNGNRFYNETDNSDNSGTTRKFVVPTPSFSYSQTPDSNIRPYALYDISVTANGFFNARSVDVPVFEGITSIQNFSLIPLPLYMRANEETVTYFNQEPNL